MAGKPSSAPRKNTMEVIANVPTKNAFDLLSKIPENTVIQKNESRKIQIPPIVLDGVPADIKEFIKETRSITKHDFLLKNTGRTTQIHAKTREDHQAILSKLKQKNTPYHTYGFQDEKYRRFVLHGLPASFTAEDIVDELKKHIPTGIVSSNQFQRTNKDGEKTKIPVFSVVTSNEISLQQLRQVPAILYHKFRAEKYQSNTKVTQCYRCQRFDHSSRHCNLIKRCVRCGGQHDAKDCDREKVTPKCANCGGDHVASYRNCPARSVKIQKRKNSTTIVKPTIEFTQRKPRTSRTVNGLSYSEITKRGQPQPNPPLMEVPLVPDQPPIHRTPPNNDLAATLSLMNEAKNVYKELMTLNIPAVICELKNMIRELKQVSSAYEKLNVIVRYAHLFDDGISP